MISRMNVNVHLTRCHGSRARVSRVVVSPSSSHRRRPRVVVERARVRRTRRRTDASDDRSSARARRDRADERDDGRVDRDVRRHAPRTLELGRSRAMLGYASPKKVVVLGIQGAGKTSVVERVKDVYGASTRGLRPEQIISTVGMNIAKAPAGVNLPVELIFWDLGGAFGLRGIWESYFKDADACAYVVDGADEGSLEESMVELERALRNAEFGKAMPVLVLSAKSDLSGPEGLEMVRASCDDVFARVDGTASKRSWRVLAVNANTGLGLRPAVEWLAHELTSSEPSLLSSLFSF